jgi:LPXTG-motif cell wall-anchored protein
VVGAQAREKTQVAREKLPASLREQPSVLLAAGGAAVIAGASGLVWLIRRRRS